VTGPVTAQPSVCRARYARVRHRGEHVVRPSGSGPEHTGQTRSAVDTADQSGPDSTVEYGESVRAWTRAADSTTGLADRGLINHVRTRTGGPAYPTTHA
jgi:hypothetical protein